LNSPPALSDPAGVTVPCGGVLAIRRAAGAALLALFSILDRARIRYAVLSDSSQLPGTLCSDLDLIIENRDLPVLPPLIFAFARTIGLSLVRAISYEPLATSFHLASLDGETLSLLHVDFSGDIRASISLSASEVLDRRQPNPTGFFVAAPSDAFAYYLAKRLAKRSLESHQAGYLSRLFHEDRDGCTAMLRVHWGAAQADAIEHAVATNDWTRIIASPASFRPRPPRRKPWIVGAAAVRRAAHILHRVRQPTGFFLACLGPDGAGKSSVIASLEADSRQEFPLVQVFHLRPGLLRGTRAGRQFTAEPHARPPRSRVASVAKFLFLSGDYLLGYWIRVRPLLTRSVLVIFDRYVQDLAADARRFRYAGPAWLIRIGIRFLPVPDLTLVLDAPSSVIHARKQELGIEEIDRQRTIYRALSSPSRRNHVRIIDASRPLHSVLHQCYAAILGTLEDRTLRRLGIIPERKQP